MPFEFEALIGHLNVVGGRAIRATPPGALCEVAPRRAARGRETDTFFTLVLPTGDFTASPTFYERMAQHAAECYFNSTGSVTAGLREVFTKLNKNLMDHNQQTQGRKYEADIACAVLRGHDLIIGRVGSSVILFQQQGLMQSFPPNLNDDEALYTAPLGVQDVPNIKLTQFHVDNGTRMVFADASIADLIHDQVRYALMSVDLATVLVGFKELARLKLTLMTAEFVPPNAPQAADLPEGESTTKINTRTRGKSTSEAGEQLPRLPSARDRRREARREVVRRVKRGAGRVALQMGSGVNMMNRALRHYFGPNEDGERSWIGTPLGAASVILLPAAVVMLVVALWLTGTGETRLDICIQEAQDNAELARSVGLQDRQTILSAWDQTLTKVEECQQIRPDEAQLITIEQEGQSVLDAINDIDRREAMPLWFLDERINLTDVVIQGRAVYVLDSNNGQVYRLDLDQSGTAIVNSEPLRDMRTGAAPDGIAVGELIGVDYNDRTSQFVALDRNGALVRCQLNFAQNCTAQRLQGVDNWENPVDIRMWNGNLYVLDPGVGNGQIWRYVPSGVSASEFLNAGEAYFGASATPPNVSNAVALDIDRSGTVYILTSEGVVFRYSGGQPEDFLYSNFTEGQEVASATSMWIDERDISQDLYITSPERTAIYELSWTGIFRNQWRATNAAALSQVSGVAAAPGTNGRELLYFVSGPTLYVMDKQGGP